MSVITIQSLTAEIASIQASLTATQKLLAALLADLAALPMPVPIPTPLPPTPTPIPTPPKLESAAGTIVRTAGPAIVDMTLESWTLVQSVASGFQIAVNGVVDAATQQVVLLLYQNHRVYQQNALLNWWYKSKASDAWTVSSDPRAPAGVESSEGSKVTDTQAHLIDARLQTWSLVTSAGQGFQISHDGTVDGAQVVLLYYHNHLVYQQNSAGGWWYYQAGAWVNTTDPRAPTPVPTPKPTVPPSSGMTFFDDFNSLNHGSIGSGAVWTPRAWANDGFADTTTFQPNLALPDTPSALFSVDNSVLRLALMNRPSNYTRSSLPFLGTYLDTSQSFTQLHGYFEALIRFPLIQGIAGAFWMVGSQGWPPEIDMCELDGFTGGNACLNGVFDFTPSNINPYANWSLDISQWHTYSVDWQADFCTFYIDRVQSSRTAVPSGYNQPMFLVLDTVAPGWVGPVANPALLPRYMEIDWVKAWQNRPF